MMASYSSKNIKDTMLKVVSVVFLFLLHLFVEAKAAKRSVYINTNNVYIAFEETFVRGHSYYVGDIFDQLNYEKIANIPVKPYWIMTTEITYRLYQAIYQWATNNGYELSDGCNGWKNNSCLTSKSTQNQHPVTLVSWMDAIVWANALSERLGLQPVYITTTGQVIKSVEDTAVKVIVKNTNGFRLPTLNEWHITARGGFKAIQNGTYGTPHAGSNNQDLVAWSEASSQRQGTGVVKQKKPNELGIYDMSGNVSEWVYDSFLSDQKITSDLFNNMHYFCGESWKKSKGLNLAYCDIHSRQFRLNDIGFRLVRSVHNIT